MLSKKTAEAQLFQEEQLDVNVDTIQDGADLLSTGAPGSTGALEISGGLDNQKQNIDLETADLLNSNNTEAMDTAMITTQDNKQGKIHRTDDEEK